VTLQLAFDIRGVIPDGRGEMYISYWSLTQPVRGGQRSYVRASLAAI